MAATVLELTDDGFRKTVLESPLPVAVDFWAPWCGPCKMVAPILEELAGELSGKLLVGKMDIVQQPQTAAQYGIRSIPAILVFRGGRVVETIIGAQPKQKLRDRIKSALET